MEGTSEQRILQLLSDVGAVIDRSHFVYTSGKHGQAYVNWVEVLASPSVSLAVALEMAQLVSDLEFDTIVGPTHTGDKVARDIGLALHLLGRTVNVVYAQETGQEGNLDFPRGQETLVRDKRVLAVDDVLTTGKTARETINAIKEAGGKVEALLLGCNRDESRSALDGVRLISLLTIPMESWDEEECQACIKQVPINTSVGHGTGFLEEFGKDPEGWPANKVA